MSGQRGRVGRAAVSVAVSVALLSAALIVAIVNRPIITAYLGTVAAEHSGALQARPSLSTPYVMPADLDAAFRARFGSAYDLRRVADVRSTSEGTPPLPPEEALFAQSSAPLLAPLLSVEVAVGPRQAASSQAYRALVYPLEDVIERAVSRPAPNPSAQLLFTRARLKLTELQVVLYATSPAAQTLREAQNAVAELEAALRRQDPQQRNATTFTRWRSLNADLRGLERTLPSASTERLLRRVGAALGNLEALENQVFARESALGADLF